MKIQAITLIILGSLLIGLVSADASLPRTGGMKVRCLDGNYYEWECHVNEVDDYYYILHILTGWDMSIIDYTAAIHPEDLATMPKEMYHTFTVKKDKRFESLNGVIGANNNELWDVSAWSTNLKSRHIWISPENDVYTGNAPPYQFLVSMGWTAYADRLPNPPPGAPFPAPSYFGTPKNSLPLLKIPSSEHAQVSDLSNPYPNAIAEDPLDGGYWEWTPEMSERLSRIGLDPVMSRTRLGYETSRDGTVTVVGMTTAGNMKTWIVIPSGQSWTTGKGQPASEDLLWILRAVDAIQDDKVISFAAENKFKVTNTTIMQQFQAGPAVTTPVIAAGFMQSDNFGSTVASTLETSSTVSASFAKPSTFQGISSSQTSLDNVKNKVDFMTPDPGFTFPKVSENSDESANVKTTSPLVGLESSNHPTVDFQYHHEGSTLGFINEFRFATALKK